MNAASLNCSLTISDRVWMNGLYHQCRVSCSGLDWTGFLYTQLTCVETVVEAVILIEIVVGLSIALLILYYWNTTREAIKQPKLNQTPLISTEYTPNINQGCLGLIFGLGFKICNECLSSQDNYFIFQEISHTHTQY